ncbi:hypothetical protein AABB24_010957 [Solanum stoloniferum]|uniref:Uncharacterized protein n=2 Tax=Solanum TaxID=4107 RepID=A0AAF0U0C1_SOLVR|nr:uncharacterized protein LOC125838167 [Solanum verrucosum]WMV34553.1 hypothetical protein MTR67_027938 [Solanum verrucosum]
MDQDSVPYISKKQKPNHADYPRKFYNIFPFKTMLLIIFLVALPLFPLQAPEIITQTGNWELVQLILVGIAVSYGLFSRKTGNDNDDNNDDDDETENEYLYSSKFDNVQSKLLDVSSFFENHQDENRVNNYQYCSGKPVVVVAKENDAIISSSFVEKPLLLPIRSLKSPVLEPISTTTNSPKSVTSSPRKIDHKIVRKQSFNKSSVSHPSPPPPLPSPSIVKKSTLLRSSSIVMDDHKGSFGKELRRSTKSVPFELSSYKGKSVRTIRPFIGAARARVYAKDFMNGKAEDERNKKVDTQMQVLQPALMDFSGEEKKTSIFENVVAESDEDSDDYIEESSENVDEERKCVVDGSPDNVDKKADEFIAKFREQIRLQRIQSIRTSAKQPAKKLIQ